jgi:hypothetical protein
MADSTFCGVADFVSSKFSCRVRSDFVRATFACAASTPACAAVIALSPDQCPREHVPSVNPAVLDGCFCTLDRYRCLSNLRFVIRAFKFHQQVARSHLLVVAHADRLHYSRYFRAQRSEVDRSCANPNRSLHELDTVESTEWRCFMAFRAPCGQSNTSHLVSHRSAEDHELQRIMLVSTITYALFSLRRRPLTNQNP